MRDGHRIGNIELMTGSAGWDALAPGLKLGEVRPATTHPLPPPLVLVADDDEDFLEMMRQALEPHYQVITAGNGEQALAIFRQQRLKQADLSLVITDICMPKMSGFELIRALQTQAVPIIAVTGYDIIQRSYSGERSIIEQCVAAIVRKPCSLTEICDAAAMILARRRLA